MVWTAPDWTVTVSVLAAAAAREMIWVWAERLPRPECEEHTQGEEFRSGARKPHGTKPKARLLDDRLKVQRASVVAGQRGDAGQIQAQIELVGAGTEVAARCHGLAEQLEASTGHAHAAHGRAR